MSGFIPVTSSILSSIRFILDSRVVSGQRPFRSTLATHTSRGNLLFSLPLSVLVEGLAAMVEGMDPPTIPTLKPRDEFFIKFLREKFFSLFITIILTV